MRNADISYDRRVGFYRVCKSGYFSEIAHSHLYHGNIVVFRQSEQRQRNSDFVIIIPFRFMRLKLFAQNARNHFFRRSLSYASGYADDRDIKLHPVIGRDIHQSLERVVHLDNRQLPKVALVSVDDAAYGAVFYRRGDKLVSIVILAVKRQKDDSFFDLSAVSYDVLNYFVRITITNFSACRFRYLSDI